MCQIKYANLLAPEKNPHRIEKMITAPVDLRPNIANTRALVIAATGISTLKGSMRSASMLGNVRPKIDAALRMEI